MRTVEMTVTQASLRELVEEVERGGEISLTREGKSVARLLPSTQGEPIAVTLEKRQRAVQAMKDMDALSKRLNLGPFDFEEFKQDRDAGRR